MEKFRNFLSLVFVIDKRYCIFLESIGLVLFMVFSAGKVVEKYLYSIVHIAVCIGLLN